MKENIEIHKKKVKNVTLKVKRDGSIHLTVPEAATDDYIERIMTNKQEWIESQIKHFNENYEQPKEKEMVSGESFKYLGKNYRLKVIESPEEGVRLYRGYIEIHVKDKNNTAKKQELLKKWYMEKAKKKFTELVNEYKAVVKADVNNIRVITMQTRWGSCNVERRNINLNLELIKKPRYCIEYVILHELAHLKFPNHSKQFWEYMSVHMPNWEWRKNKLEEK
ncbi:SprT family zinc-dependent metalloprotease [Clostridium sp.]|uniref:M48 family metallopeptidase n=1 Tax=Clostridium sp. TaxID=1506 RepID=UPI002623BC41|nr:SprT family zinc-dependent metalloprotease [Clostridium sp.]